VLANQGRSLARQIEADDLAGVSVEFTDDGGAEMTGAAGDPDSLLGEDWPVMHGWT
jgi:hypothetical protein